MCGANLWLLRLGRDQDMTAPFVNPAPATAAIQPLIKCTKSQELEIRGKGHAKARASVTRGRRFIALTRASLLQRLAGHSTVMEMPGCMVYSHVIEPGMDFHCTRMTRRSWNTDTWRVPA